MLRKNNNETQTAIEETKKWNDDFLTSMETDNLPTTSVDTNSKHWKQNTRVALFKSPTAQRNEKFINEFLSDLNTKLANIPEDLRKLVLKDVELALKLGRNAEHINKLVDLVNNQDYMNSVADRLTASTMPSDQNDDSFLSPLYQFVDYIKQGPMSFIFGEAAGVNWQEHAGIPAGGPDICAGIIAGCAQGYLTHDNSPWDNTDPVYNRVLVEMNSNAGLSYREQLRTCMNADAVGSQLVNAMNGMSTNNTLLSACATQTSIWQQWQVTGSSLIPSSACPQYQNNFATLGQHCQSNLGAFLEGGKIAAIVVGGVVGLAALCLVAYFARKKCLEKNYGVGERLSLLLNRH